LYIPRLKRALYVVEGDDDAELRLGPGHVPGTATPGTTGNAVIAGHRDTHFRALGQLRRGDEVIVQTHEGKFAYRVTGTSIVLPSDVSSLQPGKTPMLHLVTCYPFYWAGPAPKRFVVEARLAKRIS
jgi:sortase A